jgi:hypothetical protein
LRFFALFFAYFAVKKSAELTAKYAKKSAKNRKENAVSVNSLFFNNSYPELTLYENAKYGGKNQQISS